MSQPSQALAALREELKHIGAGRQAHEPVRWGDLLEALDDAVANQEQTEHDEYMGDDQ